MDFNIESECRLNFKQETQAKEPTGLIRVIWIIRVLKKISSLCLKEHEICRRPTDQRKVMTRIDRILIKQQARNAS